MKKPFLRFSLLLAGILVPGILFVSSLHAQSRGTQVLKDSDGNQVRYGGKLSDAQIMIPEAYQEKSLEFRGCWVATIVNLDFPANQTVDEFKQNYLNVVKNLAAANFNAIIFQVRPLSDAFYPSQLNPWSRYLVGAEGQSLGENFDPLEYMVRTAHQYNLEFHAWFNPYRVIKSTRDSKAAYLNSLDPKNFARRHPECVLDIPGNDGTRQLLLNPGEVAVRQFILDTVMEVARNYAVDAIHFDDYFYPYGGTKDVDMELYRRTNPNNLDLASWRRLNVNLVIKSIHDALAQLNAGRPANKPYVQFGISPFGIWRNQKNDPAGSLSAGYESYSGQFADTRKWMEANWIDYIIPQIYWNFAHDVAAYAPMTDWWNHAVQGSHTRLYIGHGCHNLLISSKWPKNELANQLRYNQKLENVQGSAIFSYKHIFQPNSDARRDAGYGTLQKMWRHKAIPPKGR